MHSWRILCNKPDGSSYFVQFRAADAELATKFAMAKGHVVDPRVPPEALPEPVDPPSRWAPGEMGGMIAAGVALAAIAAPILCPAAVVVGAMAVSESRGKRGWIGLILGVVVAVAWQATAVNNR